MGDLVNTKDFLMNGVVGVLGTDFGAKGDGNPLASVNGMFNLSGGGLVKIFVPTLEEGKTFFADSGLASTNLVTDLEAEIFEGVEILFTELKTFAASGAFLVPRVLIEDPGDRNLVGAFNGEPGDLGDPGGKVFDPDPDFFTAEGKVIMF